MTAKVVTYDELKQHTKKDSIWVLINGKVYDVTKFIDEHPGGDEVIMSEAGKDGTEAFEDVGHSDEARALLPGMLVGEFEKNSELKTKSYPSAAAVAAMDKTVQQTSNVMYFVPLAVLVAYFAWRFYS
ncbi:cytochrome b5 [Amylostereum chailletii]|nr:cytochrome b5 [Amylostereum chailletii]